MILSDVEIFTCRKCGEQSEIQYSYITLSKPLQTIELWITCPNCHGKTNVKLEGLLKDIHHVNPVVFVEPELDEPELDESGEIFNDLAKEENRFKGFINWVKNRFEREIPFKP